MSFRSAIRKLQYNLWNSEISSLKYIFKKLKRKSENWNMIFLKIETKKKK